MIPSITPQIGNNYSNEEVDNQTLNLKDLTKELLLNIFRRLSFQDLSRVASTCRQLRAVAYDDAIPPRIRLPKIDPLVVFQNAFFMWYRLDDNNIWLDQRCILRNSPPQRHVKSFSSCFRYTDHDYDIKSVTYIIAQTLTEIYVRNVRLSESKGTKKGLCFVYLGCSLGMCPAYELGKNILQNMYTPKPPMHRYSQEPSIIQAAKLLYAQEHLYKN